MQSTENPAGVTEVYSAQFSSRAWDSHLPPCVTQEESFVSSLVHSIPQRLLQVMEMLDRLYGKFDELTQEHELYKVYFFACFPRHV